MLSFPLHLLRHGEPELAGRMLGRTDSPATPDGISACARRARGLSVHRRIASDLNRASACAAAIGAFTPDPRWREMDFGAWDGLAAAEVEPGALGRFWADPDANPPPEGERWSALTTRVAEAIDALAPEPTLVVTHAGPMRAALHHLCGMTLDQAWAFDLPYTALLTLRVWDGTPRRAQITSLRG